jgi:hypothetical protein
MICVWSAGERVWGEKHLRGAAADLTFSCCMVELLYIDEFGL